MSDDLRHLHNRLRSVEQECRRLRAVLALAVIAVLGFASWSAHVGAQQSTDLLRVRGLIVEDSNGQPRV